MDCLEPEWSTETVLETRTGRDGVDPFSYGDRPTDAEVQLQGVRSSFPVRGMTLAADRESGHSPDHDRRNTPAVSG